MMFVVSPAARVPICGNTTNRAASSRFWSSAALATLLMPAGSFLLRRCAFQHAATSVGLCSCTSITLHSPTLTSPKSTDLLDSSRTGSQTLADSRTLMRGPPRTWRGRVRS